VALGVPVEPVEAVGWNGDALEAQCFGFLAARVVAGLPLSFPSTTGVPLPMLGGRIAAPVESKSNGQAGSRCRAAITPARRSA
jgi:anhydro-N-acetylmuramic acid kinase